MQEKYKCNKCDSLYPCYLTIDVKFDGILLPSDCPFGGERAKWVYESDEQEPIEDYRCINSIDENINENKE